MLHVLFCGSEYRMTVDRLGVPSATKNELAKAYRDLRDSKKRWFSPEVDVGEPKSASKWTRDGSGYPHLTTFGSMAISKGLDEKVRDSACTERGAA
jgi:hypothetical protein